jgi:transcriptional regulator with XRE-family HTH domain
MARLSAAALSFMEGNSSIALPLSQALLHCANKASLYDVEMTLGKRIKSARERLRPEMTQGDVAKHFNITDKAVSAWERDATVPELDKIAKLARVLRVPANWLLEGKGPPPSPDALESVMEQLDQESRSLLEAMAQTLLKQRGAAA